MALQNNEYDLVTYRTQLVEHQWPNGQPTLQLTNRLTVTITAKLSQGL